MDRKPLAILAGPTASGKTRLSIALAKAAGGEIISADSMQVYRHMDIGSAKIREEEKQGITHYLTDVLEPEEEFSAARFLCMANSAAEEIYEKGKLPIVVGGTGFYIHAFLYDTDFDPQKGGREFRAYLEALAEERGAAHLYDMLLAADPDAAKEIHQNNVKRVIRALEFYEQTGVRISEHNRREREKPSPYNAAFFVLNDDRARIYENIDRRVDLMIRQGLVGEVRKLKERGLTSKTVSMQGLGYKEILSFLDGESTLEEAVYRIKRDTRHFAKRQLTWFKRERDAIWVDRRDFGGSDDGILKYMLKVLREKGITTL